HGDQRTWWRGLGLLTFQNPHVAPTSSGTGFVYRDLPLTLVCGAILFGTKPYMSKKRTSVPKRSKLQQFLISFVLLLVVLGLAARPLAKDAMFSQSYWGGAVFAPFLLLVAAPLLWDSPLIRRDPPSRSTPRDTSLGKRPPPR